MLTSRLHMEFTPLTIDEAGGALRSLVDPVGSETGCSATRLLRDTEDGCRLTWVEEWRGVEDFERHLRAKTFRQILAVIELASLLPTVEIDDVASRRDFELVEEILGQTQVNQAEHETG